MDGEAVFTLHHRAGDLDSCLCFAPLLFFFDCCSRDGK